MASGSKPRSAKQGVSYANVTVASSTPANRIPVASPTMRDKPAAATDAITVLQATLQKAMQEMAQVSDILKGLQSDVKSVKSSQAKMKTDVAAIYQRLDEADSRIMDLEVENARLSKEIKERAKQHEDMQRAVQDAANRDRRLNLRLVGIKEKLESGAPREYVRRIISEVLGIDLAENELQRVHRSLAPMPNEGQPPRPIIMRFLSYLERDRVLNAARVRYREKREVKWQGDNISFFPDMTRDVVEKRRKFSDVRKKLHEMDVRFTLAYPAVIRFSWEGRKVSFEDHRKAMEFITKEAEPE